MLRHIFHHTTIDATLDEIVALLDTPNSLLGPIVQRAEDGDDPVAALHAHFLGADVEKRIEIHASPIAQLTRSAHRLPIEWRAEHDDGRYPVMRGELEFSAMSEHPPRSEVAFIGHYAPPLGLLGALGDVLVGHKIAQEAVEGFVRDVCARMTAHLKETVHS